ncbi:tetratricopeptide repeat protein [Polynucleobacter wuianus]|uniref:tetratricopeptide repeat protein n=1 Tax=Polynucleobacter wuianus TaxID=1743168 RepID=UPI001C0E4AF7|nr:tetratricopeptide repeat protein [Polynucleobacter wuianus]MBU3611046.1 tetratricopeptide repeat protein [Polynucleobacter wuianus]
MNPQLQALLQQAIRGFQGGNIDGADLILKKILQNDINNADAVFELGIAYAQESKFSEAIVIFRCLDSLNTNNADIPYNLGFFYAMEEKFECALESFDKANKLNPNDLDILLNYASTLHELKRFDEAVVSYDKILNLNIDNEEFWYNKGNTLYELKRFDEAIAHYDKALSLEPDYAEAWSNKGNTLNELKRFDEAIAHYDKALSLQPDYHEASWNKSLSLLLQGDFENGLPLYESRWYATKASEIAGKRLFDKPAWLGKESLQHKTILLYGEQGLGDFIQFCRYVKLVAGLGANVILEVPKPLASLMENLEGVSRTVIKGEDLPLFDYQCPLMSLPLALNIRISSIPMNVPYIATNPSKVAEWSSRLGEKRKKRIGLVWSSVSNFKDDSKRSLTIAEFAKALPQEGFEYICLQKELKDCDKNFFEVNKNIRFFGDELCDFSDTAALIENIDLVISTCTSVPHLSGALGKETWVLLPHVPDWRWLLDRADSPWYPSVKLYRQTSIGDWDSILDRVKSDLSGNP